MGAGYTKLLNFLDAGPDAKEDKLKKKYNSVLTTGVIPKKPDLKWKSVSLSKSDDEKNVAAFMEGCDFIHLARMKKHNVLICIASEDPDSVTFATAYFMILSGLSVELADQALVNALKETDLKLMNTYKKSLQLLRDRYKPDEIRTQMFKNAGGYSMTLLSEDVTKICELCGLPKPSDQQIKLEVPIHAAVTSVAAPEPSKDEPIKLEPVKDGPAKPEPVKDGPSKPEPIKDGPAKPEPVKDGPAKPEPVKDGPAKPEPVKDGPAKPEPVKDGPAKPESVKDGPAKPEPVKDGPAKPEPVKDGPAKPEPVKDGPAKPEPVKDGPAKPEPVKDGPAKPEPVKDGPAKPEPVKDVAAKPEPVKDGPVKLEPVKDGPVQYDSVDDRTKKNKHDQDDLMQDNSGSWIDASLLGENIPESPIKMAPTPVPVVSAAPPPQIQQEIQPSTPKTPEPKSPTAIVQHPTVPSMASPGPVSASSAVSLKSRLSVDEDLRKLAKESGNQLAADQINGDVSESALNDLMKVTKVDSVHSVSAAPPTAVVTKAPITKDTPRISTKPEPERRKIRIVRSITKEATESSNSIDEYLTKTTEEERKRSRRPVTIVRAYSKVSD